MALTSCPDCGGKCSARAISCVHCGGPLPSIQRNMSFIVGLFFYAFLLTFGLLIAVGASFPFNFIGLLAVLIVGSLLIFRIIRH